MSLLHSLHLAHTGLPERGVTQEICSRKQLVATTSDAFDTLLGPLLQNLVAGLGQHAQPPWLAPQVLAIGGLSLVWGRAARGGGAVQEAVQAELRHRHRGKQRNITVQVFVHVFIVPVIPSATVLPPPHGCLALGIVGHCATPTRQHPPEVMQQQRPSYRILQCI